MIPAPGADPSIDQPVPQAQQCQRNHLLLGNVPEQITPPDTQNSQADGLRSLLESDGSDSNPPNAISTKMVMNEKLDNAASPSDETDESNVHHLSHHEHQQAACKIVMQFDLNL